jgi:hypothetical protein
MTPATTNNATTTISHTAARSVQRHFHRRRVASFVPFISRTRYVQLAVLFARGEGQADIPQALA